MWTKQGLRKMIDDDCKVIMEVKEQTTDIPLSLTNSIRIPPHTVAVAVVECASPLNSTMDIRADKVVGFAQLIAEDVEVHALADHEEIAEMMRGPRNHIPRKTQAKYKMPIIPLDNAFITSPADVPGPRKVDLQDADITPGMRSALMRSVRDTLRFSLKGMRTLVKRNWL